MDYPFLKHALWSSYSKDIAYPKFQEQRTSENRTIGMCAITSLIVQDFFGGEIVKARTKNTVHYRNVIEGKKWDFTAEQFEKYPNYLSESFVKRENILDENLTIKRYTILKNKIKEFIQNYQDIEDNIHTCRLCSTYQAEHFYNTTIHFGRDCRYLLIGEAPARNGWIKSGKAWMTSQGKLCPSGKILQKLLDIRGLNLFDLTFTEAIKCFPQKRNYLKQLSCACTAIYEQIFLLKPTLILPLGNAPTKMLLSVPYRKFSEVVGRLHPISIYGEEYKILPMYHPSPISPISYSGNIPIFEKMLT